jgi:hypothetical protein
LLDKAVGEAGIGTELTCLDVPNVTSLGWYGTSQAGEESALADCFDAPLEYETLLQRGDAAFNLEIADAFTEASDAHAGVSLGRLVPWLPRVDAQAMGSSRLSARVSIRDARFVTLVGVASKLQGQAAEGRCLEALCKPDTSYVQKALVGTPSVTLSLEDATGKSLELNAGLASGGFIERRTNGGARELTSEKPVTLAVARSAFRTAHTDRLCDFCGKRGQHCCAGAVSCDGGLGCIDARCVAVGAPGEPCDGQSCSGGAICVDGSCQLSCGGRNQPCCAGSACSGKLKCTADPENALEFRVFSEDVEVSGRLLGNDEDRSFGAASCGPLKTRARYAVTKLESGRGTCEKAWWFEPKNARDCRMSVHFEVSPFGSIRCRVEAFALAPPKPDICL